MADYQNELEAYEQQMPYNLEAEQSVLGAILIDPASGNLFDYVPDVQFGRSTR